MPSRDRAAGPVLRFGRIIIIDFIDMDERRNRQKVMQALEESCVATEPRPRSWR